MIDCGCYGIFIYRGLSLFPRAQCLPQIEQGQGFPQVSRQLFGNFLYFERLFSFRAILILQLSSNSEILQQF